MCVKEVGNVDLKSFLLLVGQKYELCWNLIHKTCDGIFEVGNRISKTDYEKCKSYCNDDINCKFFFHIPNQNQSQNCMKYSSCEQTRVPVYPGNTYSKSLHCPGKKDI